MRFLPRKSWLLSPLLALGLLLPAFATPASAAVNPCTAGGFITVYPSGNVGGVALAIQCQQNFVSTTNVIGSSSSQIFYTSTPPANASWNNTYCAGSSNGIDRTVWDPIAVTRSGNTYTLKSTASPVTSPDGPQKYEWAYGQEGAPTINQMATKSPLTIEATGDSSGDPSTDSRVENYIVSGAIYYKWNLTGETWQNGADPINNYAYHWVYSYSDAPFQWTTAGPAFNSWVVLRGTAAPPTYTSPVTITTQTIVARTGTSKTVVTKKNWYVITYSLSIGRAATFVNSIRTDYETDANAHYTWTRYLASVTPGVRPACVPYSALAEAFWDPAQSGVASASEEATTFLSADPFIFPSAIKISNPASYVAIPASWTSLANLTANVKPGTFSQILGRPDIQVVGVPFPYAVRSQSYTGGSFSGSCSVTPTSTQQCVLGPIAVIDPTTHIEYFVTLVSDVGLVGVKWDWGDPASTASPQVPTNGDQTIYPPATGLGNCSPTPFCGPVHTPTRIGNYKINVFEYYGSSIWAYYYDSTQGGLVSVNLGTGLPSYTGCKDASGKPNDPNPSVRPSGASFCLTPTPAAPGTPEVLSSGLQTGGYPYNVGQIEGVPAS